MNAAPLIKSKNVISNKAYFTEKTLNIMDINCIEIKEVGEVLSRNPLGMI